MQIRIVDISIARSVIVIEVAAALRGAPLEPLRAFVNRCKTLEIKNIELYYKDDVPARTVKKIDSLCAAEELPPPRPAPPDIAAGAPVREDHLPESKKFRNKKGFTEYSMYFRDLNTVVGDLTTTVMLVGEALEVDPRSQFMLRLCVYELIVNTVEHATFGVDSPAVSVVMQFMGERVFVSFADNAEPFMADSTSSVDMVEEQIKSSSKRGLGLYLLNNICNEWQSERAEGWNVTTFSLEINRDMTPVTER